MPAAFVLPTSSKQIFAVVKVLKQFTGKVSVGGGIIALLQRFKGVELS